MRWALALILVGNSLSAFALEWSPYASLAMTRGGDSLGKNVSVKNGESTTSHIRAGQYMLFSAGVTVPLPNLPDWEAQASIGYWFDLVGGNGGELKFKRIPIELVAIRNFDSIWRVSGGLSYHTAVERTCTQDTCDVPNTRFDNALGLVAEVDWLVSGPVTAGLGLDQPRPMLLWFGLRATVINYQAPQSEGGKYNGNNLGLILGLNF